ncbi:class I SAM-dependent DNA methyltransferase [Rhizobium sp. GN54]|uniref:class I SAM-dependent DNA methyltransferase n=1 Tax=Rhizobium sp. GN54 TaxID=2898150 RepID=UPI001E2C802D|nr:class I SAM-dependent methyltransferase [Rhizobium sp. GN54]MCD2180818.1 class I SAM-dependent methyltransferase [Rhizobium sp. GN54]
MPAFDRLFDDVDLAGFYDLENGWGADLDTCRALAADAGSVLDLGCGTGELAVSLAGGRRVAGVDPAAAMLDIARAKPGAAAVCFIEGDARAIRLGETFDLIVMTGHAFQVFLTEADQRAVLATIAAHLSPSGRFVFDSRNPAVREWEEWVPQASERDLVHDRLGPVTAWNDAAHDPATGIVTYETHYLVTADGRQLSATSQILFSDRDRIEALLAESGLTVQRWAGDWQGGDWHPGAPEIIPIGGLAAN